MIIRDRPTITTTTIEPCQFHRDFPDKSYAGCTCFASIHIKTKPLGDWTPEEHLRFSRLEGKMRALAPEETEKAAQGAAEGQGGARER